jgi:glycosyltransferase involved in cell wall biosynthesis
VATRHGGIQDVVIDGETGLLVNEEDVEGMGEHMLRLARDPALAAKLGQAGRKRVCAEFSMEKSIANLYRIIEATVIKKNSL